MSSAKFPFNVWITPSCLQKLNYYATEALPTEVGGFARIEEKGENVFVTDIYIPKQDATGGTFDITPEMDGEFIRNMMKDGKRKELREWKSIVHSHPVGMGPSMSGVDVEAIKRRAEDGECYSLIISASRTADSDRMFMHYCTTLHGKQFIWSDIPVSIGWDSERMEVADKLVELAFGLLGVKEPSKKDAEDMQRELRTALCTNLGPLMELESKELRAAIKKEVAERVSKPSYGRGGTYRGAFPHQTVAGSQKPIQDNQSLHSITADQYLQRADLEKGWKSCQRLYAIGYDLVDPLSNNPNHFVTKEQAKKSRKLYKKTVIELNKELRKLGGIGMGDLVLVDSSRVNSIGPNDDLAITPTEVADFQYTGGEICYEVGGEMFYKDELIPITQYEDIMDWNPNNKVIA